MKVKGLIAIKFDGWEKFHKRLYMRVIEESGSGHQKICVSFINKKTGLPTDIELLPMDKVLDHAVRKEFGGHGLLYDQITSIERLLAQNAAKYVPEEPEGYSFIELYSDITKYAQEKGYIENYRNSAESADGTVTPETEPICMIPTDEFRALPFWHAYDKTYNKFLNILAMYGLLRNNKGRKDYRKKSDGKLYFRFDAFREDIMKEIEAEFEIEETEGEPETDLTDAASVKNAASEEQEAAV